MIFDSNYLQLTLKIIPNDYLDSSGKIKEEFKYKINIPELKIKDSKFIPNPEDKFETMLFLPPNSNRIAEGGLRAKGLFKFSYKKVKSDNVSGSDGIWYICDLDGNPAIPAPDKLQEKINQYTSNLSPTTFLPLITVITVVYNGAKYLEDTIKSVINQTYPNVEYIIIDGGSTDGTIDIIKKYEDYIDYWVSEPDKGIYDAMNKGIVVASGQWINFLGSDDIILSNAVNNILKYLNKKNIAVYGNVIMKTTNKVYDGKFNYFKLFFKRNICHQSIFYNAKIIKRYSFNLKYSILADYALNLVIFIDKYFIYAPYIIAIYNDKGKSSNIVDYNFKKDKIKLLFSHIFNIMKLRKILNDSI